MSRLGNAPDGIYSDDGQRLEGLLHPSGRQSDVVIRYESEAALVADWQAGKLAREGGVFRVNGRVVTYNGTDLIASDGNKLVRNVASRMAIDYLLANTNPYLLSRSSHFAHGNITSLGIAVPNWYVSKLTSDTETALGSNNLTVQAAIEYPSGTFTNITFSGSNTGTVAPLTTLSSDIVAINIPIGAQFWIRQYKYNPDGFVYNDKGYAGTGTVSSQGNADGAIWGATLAALGGATVSSGQVYTQYAIGNQCYVSTPLAIFGTTDKPIPAIALVGDSRVRGENDTDSSSFYLGELDRSLGQYYNTANYGVSSDQLALYSTNKGALRRTLVNKYFTHVICELGVNDWRNSISLATMKSNAIALAANFSSTKNFFCTLAPFTTTTDNWATATNQSVTATESIRTGYNDWLRAGGIAGIVGCFDIASLVEVNSSNVLTLNGGRWIANGTVGYAVSVNATDSPYGIHETTLGNQVIAAGAFTKFPIFSL